MPGNPLTRRLIPWLQDSPVYVGCTPNRQYVASCLGGHDTYALGRWSGGEVGN